MKSDSQNELSSVVLAPHSLTADDRSQLLQLLVGAFDNVNRTQFHRDLDEKHWVLLIRDGDQRIRGFTTLMRIAVPYDGQEYVALYSGDSIVDPEVRAARPMHGPWVNLIWSRFLEENTEYLYWINVCLTYQPYRLMRFFHRYVPSAEPAEPQLLGIRDALCKARFGDRYDPGTGTVNYPYPMIPRELTGSERLPTDPLMQQFYQFNPRYTEGVGLVCVAHLAIDNVAAEALNMPQ